MTAGLIPTHSTCALIALRGSSIQPCGFAFSIMAREGLLPGGVLATSGAARSASCDTQAVSASTSSAVPASARRDCVEIVAAALDHELEGAEIVAVLQQHASGPPSA